MNLKAEFSKAGELALASGTLIVLGWVLFVMGSGVWGVAIAPGTFDSLDLIGWGILVAFLVTYFYGYCRGNKACAVIVAFTLNFMGWLVFLKMNISGSTEDVIPPGDLARGTIIGVLIWVLGLLLLWFRFSRTMRSPIVYVLVGAAPFALLGCMAWRG